MRNGDKPASAIRNDVEIGDKPNWVDGLTKREYFAGLAMQGDFAAQSPEHGEMLSMDDCKHRASIWVAASDALLAELEKQS